MQPLIPFFEVPVLQLGPLPIHGFGMLVALGFLIGGNVAIRRANETGLDGEKINTLLGWLVIGTFVGGHVGYGLMYDFENYMRHPEKFLEVWHGLSSMGGFLVCVPLSFWFFRRHKLPVWPYMDSLAIGLSMGWFLGRMGCTVAHDHPGTPSNFFLAKYCRPVEGHTFALPDFMTADTADLRWGPCRYDGDRVTDIAQTVSGEVLEGGVMAVSQAAEPIVVAAHDMGFYEALWSLGVYVLFLFLDRTPRKPGFYVTLLGVLYGPVRFAMDFLRPETTDGRWFLGTALEMTPAQFWAIAFFAVALWGFWLRLRADARPIGPTAPLTPGEPGYAAPAGE